jgi:hypothetical protein
MQVEGEGVPDWRPTALSEDDNEDDNERIRH